MFEKKNLTRGLESVLKNLPVNDGKLRFTTDTARLFLDNDTTRIEITDFVKGLPEGQIRGIVTPLPKFYYAADTRRLLYYHNGEWLQVNHHVEYADKDGVGNNIKNTYAPLNSPSLSGTPTTPTPTTSSSNTMIANKEYVDNSVGDINGLLSKYAPLESPNLTGTPTVPTPTASSGNTTIVNKEYVDNIVKNSIGGVTQIEYKVLSALPATGEKGVIYFIYNNSGETNNVFDEYVWVNDKFELMGPIKMEISTDFGDLDE